MEVRATEATIPMSGECRKIILLRNSIELKYRTLGKGYHLSHEGRGEVLEMRWCSLYQYSEETGEACSGAANRR